MCTHPSMSINAGKLNFCPLYFSHILHLFELANLLLWGAMLTQTIKAIYLLINTIYDEMHKTF